MNFLKKLRKIWEFFGKFFKCAGCCGSWSPPFGIFPRFGGGGTFPRPPPLEPLLAYSNNWKALSLRLSAYKQTVKYIDRVVKVCTKKIKMQMRSIRIKLLKKENWEIYAQFIGMIKEKFASIHYDFMRVKQQNTIVYWNGKQFKNTEKFSLNLCAINWND